MTPSSLKWPVLYGLCSIVFYTILNQTWPSDMVTLNLLSLHCYSKSYSRTYWFKTMDTDYLTRTQWTRDFGKLYLRNIYQFSVWITAPGFKLSLALAWKTSFKVVHWYKWQVSVHSLAKNLPTTCAELYRHRVSPGHGNCLLQSR